MFLDNYEGKSIHTIGVTQLYKYVCYVPVVYVYMYYVCMYVRLYVYMHEFDKNSNKSTKYVKFANAKFREDPFCGL